MNKFTFVKVAEGEAGEYFFTRYDITYRVYFAGYSHSSAWLGIGDRDYGLYLEAGSLNTNELMELLQEVKGLEEYREGMSVWTS